MNLFGIICFHCLTSRLSSLKLTNRVPDTCKNQCFWKIRMMIFQPTKYNFKGWTPNTIVLIFTSIDYGYHMFQCLQTRSGLVTGFIEHLDLVITINSRAIAI
jgi:hypothetical protein